MADNYSRTIAWVVAVIAFVIGGFHLLNVSGLFVLSTPDVRIFHLLMMMAILFLSRPTFKRLEGNPYDRLFSLILVAAGCRWMPMSALSFCCWCLKRQDARSA
jgi:TRAP-type uncharacterized transport system fused permease subunit